MYNIVLNCIVLFCTVLYCTVLHCVTLYCIVLSRTTALYCIVLSHFALTPYRWCRENDDKCREIAHTAQELYKMYVSREGILDYMQVGPVPLFVCTQK